MTIAFPPHFHAYYGDHGAITEIETLKVMAGSLPQRAFAMVLEGAFTHRNELMEDWMHAKANKPLN